MDDDLLKEKRQGLMDETRGGEETPWELVANVLAHVVQETGSEWSTLSYLLLNMSGVDGWRLSRAGKKSKQLPKWCHGCCLLSSGPGD